LGKVECEGEEYSLGKSDFRTDEGEGMSRESLRGDDPIKLLGPHAIIEVRKSADFDMETQSPAVQNIPI